MSNASQSSAAFVHDAHRSAGSAVTLAQLLFAQQAARPGNIALRHKHRGIWSVWRWREVYREVTHLARGLGGAGIGFGDCVAVWAEAHPSSLITALAAHVSGASVLPIPEQASAAWLARAFNETAVGVAIVRTREQADTLRASVPPARRALLVVIELEDDAGSERDELLSFARFTAQGDVSAGPSLEQIKASVAAADGTAPAFHYFPDDVDAHWRRSSIDHQRLVAAAHMSITRDAITTTDEVLGETSLWFLPHVHLMFAQWLAGGFRLSLPERADTLHIDRREIGPTVLYATRGFYDRLVDDTARRAGAAGSWRRRWLHAALPALNDARRRGSRDLLSHLLDGALVLRPLRDVLGLSRVRLAVASDGELSERADRFLQSLAVPVAALTRHHSVASASVHFAERDAPPAAPRPEATPIEELVPGNSLGATL